LSDCSGWFWWAFIGGKPFANCNEGFP
jgi:hypothetical protein